MKRKTHGADESGKTFGPGLEHVGAWLLTKFNGEQKRSHGKTAFAAAANAGWSLGELRDIQPMTAPPAPAKPVRKARK